MRLRTFLSALLVLGAAALPLPARSESAYLPAPDDKLKDPGTFGNPVTAPPLAVIIPPGLGTFAADSKVHDLILRLLGEADKSPATDFLYSMQTDAPGKQLIVPQVGNLMLQIYGIERRTMETFSGMATLVSDRATYDAVARCVGTGGGVTDEAGTTLTPYHPDIFSKCVEKYKADPVSLVANTGLSTDSLVKQFFNKDEIRELVWTFVGDSKLEAVTDANGKKTAVLKAAWGPYKKSNNAEVNFRGLRGRAEDLAAKAGVEIGANCDKLPAPTSFKWRTDMLSMQEIPINADVYREAYKSSEWCGALKTALGAEAAAREADLALTYMTFAAYQGVTDSLTQEGLTRLTVGLRSRLESWRREQSANRGTYADVQQTILEARLSRQASAAAFLSTTMF